jgi:hypothetical protein
MHMLALLLLEMLKQCKVNLDIIGLRRGLYWLTS